MADDTNFRSYRPVDQRWPAQGAPASGQAPGQGSHGENDPLAELARLIGQTDPFGELNRTASPRPEAVPSRPTAVPRPTPVAAPLQPPMRAPQTASSYQNDPYGSPMEFGGKPFDRRNAGRPQDAFHPAYDPAVYGAPQQASGHSAEVDDDIAHMPHGDEAYDENYIEERPRRLGLRLVMMAVLAVAVGGSGLLAYRAFFSSGSSAPPPVIKANIAPSKVAAAPSASSKQINDRVGDASQGERVVSREETPVEVKDTSRAASRVGWPEPSSSPNGQDSVVATASATPPLPTDPGGPASAEPKKIRTVTIRPDQITEAAAARQNPASQAQRAAAPAPAAPAAPQAAPAQAPQRPAPAAQNNAPLSLMSPQVASAETSSARPAFPPPPAPAAPARVASAPTTAGVATGAYTVQISSQRSENEAQASFRSLQAKYPSILGDRQPIIRRADLGDKGIYFRAMVGPFASVEQATQFCGSLKSAGGQCLVQRN